MSWKFWNLLLMLALGFVFGVLCAIAFVPPAHAHMPDRPDLNPWFSDLKNDGGGLCCSMEEGTVITAEEWRNTEVDKCEKTYAVVPDSPAEFCVLWKGHWRQVYRYAVVSKPNRYGPALVWPVYEWNGDDDGVWFRCFIPGAGA